MYRPPDCPTEKFSSPKWIKNKTNRNRKSNAKYHIYRRPELSNCWLANGNSRWWKSGEPDENQVQAKAFLQFAQEQCFQQYIEEPSRKNNILDVFLTNNDQLTWQIIIVETSMSDHNIIQIETNIKFVEEKEKHKIKKSNLSYRDLNFFNEDFSWASIDLTNLGFIPAQHKLDHALNRSENWWNV